MIPLPLAQMQTTVLRDRVELRSFEGVGGAKVFAEKFNATINPRMLAVSKRADGLYYIAPGFFEGGLITGSGQVSALTQGQRCVLKSQVIRYRGSNNDVGEYFTGGYAVLSAELTFSRAGIQVPDDTIVAGSNAYLYTTHEFLFDWNDSYLRRIQPWNFQYGPKF
jgi:hypothetical protein